VTRALLALIVLSSFSIPGLGAPADLVRCDLLFAGSRVVDGTGSPAFRADVCVAGDRIAAMGDLSRAETTRRIDAKKLIVAPGFIDMLGQSEYFLLVDNRAASKVTQGITTELTGEGTSIAPVNTRMVAERRDFWAHYGVTPDWTTLAGYFLALDRARPAINLGTFVGAGSVRDLVIGKDNRPATSEELKAMEATVAQAMEEGAFGLSTSLAYVPDRFASTEEILALGRVAARYGGVYITHQRSEGNGIDRSLDEVFRIAREARIPAEIYHLKTAGRKVHMRAVLKRLEKARADGLEIWADQYPYTASANGLDASLPIWAREGGTEKLLERLKDPATRACVKADLLKRDSGWGSGRAARILIVQVLRPDLKKYEGKTLAAIAREERKHPIDALIDLVIADRANAGKIEFITNESDVRAALRHPLVSVCTDAGARATDGPLSQEKSHPRAWGTTARILGQYVREEKLLPLEEAIRKMTSLPATRLKLRDRGVLKAGMMADLVAFDPETIRERSTYADPAHYCEGIPFVAVNGQLVVDEGRITAARPGRVLRGPGFRSDR
jgi:N-acyl-D-amino-acid deacylase